MNALADSDDSVGSCVLLESVIMKNLILKSH